LTLKWSKAYTLKDIGGEVTVVLAELNNHPLRKLTGLLGIVSPKITLDARFGFARSMTGFAASSRVFVRI
jgi:hypothetical protein